MQLWLVMIKTDQLIAKYVKCWIKTLFYIKNTFISNVKLKLVENQANAKQHPETELLLFENYSHSSSKSSSKNNRSF